MPPRPLLRKTRYRSTSSRWMPDSLRARLVRFLRRLQGGLIIAVAIAFAVLLLTYDAQDVSWNTAAGNGEIRNLLGYPGSYAADFFWQFFGVAGGLFAVILAAWGWLVIAERRLDLLPMRLLAVAVSVLAFGAASYALQTVAQTSGSDHWGGAFGKILGQWALNRLPEPWGAYAFSFLMFILALGALYLAAALTLDEWRSLAIAMKDFLHRTVRKISSSIRRAWCYLRHDQSHLFEDEDEDSESAKPFGRAADKTSRKAALAPKPEPKKTPIVSRSTLTMRQPRLPFSSSESYSAPPLDLLQWPEAKPQAQTEVSIDVLEKNARLLETVLADFGVQGHIIKVSPGPVVTLYELEPSPGTRASRVISLADDIARNMSAASVRVAIVPGRNVIGIELPNRKREMVYLRELLSCEAYANAKANLPLILGKDIAGNPVIADVVRMPHLLIAGTTGSGKSVAINTMILSLIYRLSPEKCRFIMIDPKMLELSMYDGIPHLLAPVVTEPKKAIMALKWTVREMDERYRMMTVLAVRNIEGYNVRVSEAQKRNEKLTRRVQTGFDRETGKPVYEEQPLDLTPLSYIVVVVDEMADLMLAAGKEIEIAVQRLSQKARAAGIHLIMATQRPSVDVITGTIRANFPERISFQVASRIDSRTILNDQGAEQLLGQGDMLYRQGGGQVTRVHGPFVKDDEVEAVVKFLKQQGPPDYHDEVTEDDSAGDSDGSGGGMGGDDDDDNNLYDKAVDIVLRKRQPSISFVQRQLRIGYNRAAILIERMESEGVISAPNRSGKREVLARKPED